MKKLLKSLILVNISLLSLFPIRSHSATNFSQQEINQENVIVVAAPVNYGKAYQLLILEQISNTRQCWREQPGEPTSVDMLLLNFDFSGICGRSVDTNGYSVRVGGEDLGWKYDLRVVKRSNELKLMAVPTTHNANTPAFEVGRTLGMPNNSFAKIVLNPGWRLTKRVYNGKILDHFYITNDQDFATLAANFSLEAVKESNIEVTKPVTFVAAGGSNIDTQENYPTYEYVAPDASSYENIEVIAPDPNSTPIASPSNLLRTPTVPKTSASAPRSSSMLPPPPDVNYAALPDNINSNFTQLPTAPTYTRANFQYRVIVYANNPNQQNQVKTVVPDAFRTKVNGQTVMQAGAFVEKLEADQLVQLLQNNGLSATIVPY